MLSSHRHGAAPGIRGKAIRYRKVVDPSSCASAAAELLRRAWAPPCLLYSDAYVGWQLAFPGPARPRAIVATAGARTVGFVAVVPRPIWLRDRVSVVYVLSFFAVHPDYRDDRIGTSMAGLILEASDRPTLTYTEPGSSSERVLARSAGSRGWAYRRIAELRTYARASVNRNQDVPAIAREATVDEFLAAVPGCPATEVAWSRPAVEQLRHYVADPRGSCLAIVQGPDDRTLGGALIVRSQIITAHGIESVPSLDAVFLDGTPAAALAALATFALDRWRADGASVVTAPNLHTVRTDAIRRAGFRATRSAFNLAVMGDESDPIVRHATTSNLEVF